MNEGRMQVLIEVSQRLGIELFAHPTDDRMCIDRPVSLYPEEFLVSLVQHKPDLILWLRAMGKTKEY